MGRRQSRVKDSSSCPKSTTSQSQRIRSVHLGELTGIGQIRKRPSEG